MNIALIGAIALTLSTSVTTARALASQNPPVPAPVTSAAVSPTPESQPSANASAAPASSAAPEDADAKVAARAKEWLGRLQKGTLDRTQLTADLNAGLQDATVAALAKQLGPLGPPQKVALRDKTTSAGSTTWVFRVVWGDQSFDYNFGLDNSTGRISALLLKPTPTT